MGRRHPLVRLWDSGFARESHRPPGSPHRVSLIGRWSLLCAAADVAGADLCAVVAVPRTLSSTGIQLDLTSAPVITSTVVKCPARRSVPPGWMWLRVPGQVFRSSNSFLCLAGVPVLSSADCQCSPGYGYNPATATCDSCTLGEYKARPFSALVKLVQSPHAFLRCSFAPER